MALEKNPNQTAGLKAMSLLASFVIRRESVRWNTDRDKILLVK